MTHSIDVEELNRLIASGHAPTVFDVRRKADYDASPKKIAGAVWRNPEKIDEWVRQLPPDKRMVVYCVKGGSVSRSVADRMCAEGIDTVFLEGGLKAWSDSGRALKDIALDGTAGSPLP